MAFMTATGHRKITPEEFEHKRQEMEEARKRREIREREAREYQRRLKRDSGNNHED